MARQHSAAGSNYGFENTYDLRDIVLEKRRADVV
jgi:hypothetical protein